MENKQLITDYYEALNSPKFKKVASTINENRRSVYIILTILQEAQGEVVAGDLAKRMGVSTARVAVALNMLDQRGLIKKYRSPTDARKTDVEITEAGVQFIDEHRQKIYAAISSMLDRLTEEEGVQLLNIIKKLAD